MTSKILNAITVKKRSFDPSLEAERTIAFKFLKTNTWREITSDGTCPYLCEWPYLDVPAMLKDKLIDYYSKV